MIYTRVVDHTREIYDTSCRPSFSSNGPTLFD
jgi:hypothetical protein